MKDTTKTLCDLPLITDNDKKFLRKYVYLKIEDGQYQMNLINDGHIVLRQSQWNWWRSTINFSKIDVLWMVRHFWYFHYILSCNSRSVPCMLEEGATTKRFLLAQTPKKMWEAAQNCVKSPGVDVASRSSQLLHVGAKIFLYRNSSIKTVSVRMDF